MKEFKIFVDLEKEEKYLNQKANEGWILKGRTIFGRYHFAKSDPQQLNYKVDYRIFSSKDDFCNYVSLFEDSGFQHIWGNWYAGSQYFLPKTQESRREIFSDKDSKAQRYKRFQHRCLYWFVFMLLYTLIDLLSIDFNLSERLFLTPGLWEMEGLKFWRSLLFELPFVLMRVVPTILFALFIISNAFFAVKAKRLYKEALAKEAEEN